MKNILSSRCLWVTYVFYKGKLALCKNRYYTALETPSSLGLYRPTKLASTSYSVSLCCLYTCISEEDDTEQLARWVLRGHRRIVRGSQVAAWDRGTSWLGLFMCRPLRPYLDLVVLDNYLAFAWCDDGSVTPVVIFVSFSYMRCYMNFCVVQSLTCQLFHKSWSLYYTG